jgi:TP901 family phage tail tape measure protein
MASRFSVDATFRALDAFSKPLARMSTAADRFTRALRAPIGQLNKMTDSVLSGMAKAAAVTSVAGAGAAVVLTNVANAGADFEQAITNVGAVSLMTRDQIADLEKKALELGATTKFSATEVANGMELMGKAGFTNTEILQGIGGVLAAAAADGAELADTAGNISNVLKGMGLATSEASRVADVLTLASSRTNSSIASLGESMSNVSSTARQFRIPLEDTVAAVALLQDVGLDASEAGSAVNTMLTKLAAPTDDVRAQMKKMGVSFQDAHGNMLPLGDVMAQLAKSAEKSGGNMDQVAFFADLVGLRGQKAAANLKDLFISGKASTLTAELRNAAGSAEKMAGIRMDTFRGDLETLGGAVDSVKIALFNTQSGPLRGVVQGMTKWVEKNQELITSKVAEYIQKIVDNKDTILLWAKRIAMAGAAVVGLKVALVVATTALDAYELGVRMAGAAGDAYTATSKLVKRAIQSEAAATVAASAATGARTAAQWLANAAINIGTFATTGFTGSTVTSTIATWASNAAMWARNAAVGAFNVVMGLAVTLVTAYRNGTLIATALEYAQAAATWVKNAAMTAGNVVLGIAAIAHGNFATTAIGAAAANGSLIASFAPFMVTVAAATAAVLALIAAWQQWKAFNAETEGLGVTGTIGEMISQGTLDPFEAVDNFQNRQAKARAAAAAPQGVSPQEGVTRAIQENNTTSRGEVTIKDTTGKAKITQAPKGKGFGLTLQPSGGF